MKPKLLIPLVVVAVLTGILALFFSRSGASPTKAQAGVGERLLPNFPLNDVARIRVASEDNEAVVERTIDGWVVPAKSSYPADFDQVSDLLRKVWEAKVVQIVQAGPSAHGRLKLLAPGKGESAPNPDQVGTLLEFFDTTGKLVGSLILGKESSSGDNTTSWQMGGGGRFVLDPSKPDRVALIPESFTEADPNVRQWLSDDFFSIQKARSIVVTNAEGTEAWRVQRENETGQFALENIPEGREVDTNKLSSLSTLLAYPRIEDVVNRDASPESNGLEKPLKAVIETFDGFIYEISVGATGPRATRHLALKVSANIPDKRDVPEGESEEDKKRLDDEFSARVKNLQEKLQKEKKFEGWVFLVPETQVTDLLKTTTDFLKPLEEKKEENVEPSSETAPPTS